MPPVLRTIATQANGIAEVVEVIFSHRAYLQQTGLWQHRDHERLRAEVGHLLQNALMQRWQKTVSAERYDAVMQQVFERKISPGSAITNLVNGGNNL